MVVLVIALFLQYWFFHHYLHRFVLLQKQLYLLAVLLAQFISSMLVLVSLVGHQTSLLELQQQQELERSGSMNWLLGQGLAPLVMLRDGMLIQINCVLVSFWKILCWRACYWSKSGAAYVIQYVGGATTTLTDKYQQNEDIEDESDLIIDFSEI